MSIRILKKALGLLVADIVIIIGIFVLQFRTDSSIIKKSGNLQITLFQSESNADEVVYRNKLRITYNGLNFSFDDQNPAVVTKNGNIVPVKLEDCNQIDNLSYMLKFSEDVKVTFALASDSSDASLSIVSELPDGVSAFSIPFNYSTNVKVKKNEGNRIVLEGKKNSWRLSASSLDSGKFTLNKADHIATYSIYDETKRFSFDTVAELAIADESVFHKNLATFRDILISSYESSASEFNVTEQIAVSYVAAKADVGAYSDALEKVPSSLKKSSQRTYFSSPYFDTLEAMNQNLEKVVREFDKKIVEASVSKSLDIFTAANVSDFFIISNNTAGIKSILQSAAQSDISKATIAQVSGILRVYCKLTSFNSGYAKHLEPILESCIAKITSACKFEGNVLTISENDTFLSVIQAIETGIDVIKYGKLTDNEKLQKTGYVIVNSYLAESSSFDLRTLCNLYPVVAYENAYYPHFEKLNVDENGNLAWAWTCAKSIEYKRTSDGSIALDVDFPSGDTHYIIVKGIPQFSSIYIYNMAFRTDPRFETYNSSGYVYKAASQTLLLKSRHKSKIESIVLEYRATKEVEPGGPADVQNENGGAESEDGNGGNGTDGTSEATGGEVSL